MERQSVRTILIDNYDSYTYNLFDQLAVLGGLDPIVVRNDELTWDEFATLLTASRVDAVVISPGPGRPEVPADFGVCAELLARTTVPTLGVCLGHQGLVVAYGGRTVPARAVMHGQISRVRHKGELFNGIPQDFEVVRYHSLTVAEPLPLGLTPTAWADDGTLMGVAADDRPLCGVQFHPESILTAHGDRIVRNFLDLADARWRARPRERAGTFNGGWRSTPSGAESRPTRQPIALRPLVERIAGPVDAELAFQALRNEGGPAVWLDSATVGVDTGRFSYLTAGGGPLHDVVQFDAGHDDDPFAFLARRIGEFEVDRPTELPFGFIGGYVGWIGYECGSRTGRHDETGPPDAALLFADRLVVVDHETEELYLVALVESDNSDGSDERSARDWLHATRETLNALRGKAAPLPPAPEPVPGRIAEPDRGREQYLADIERCHELLRAGETYEVCLTTQFRVRSTESGFDVYRRLRRTNPAPYAAYVEIGETTVCGSSPECFMRVRRTGPKQSVEVKPIKGTARRDKDPETDRRLRDALAADPKERAENLMIVDLLRNDLGQVCRPGSIGVPSLMAIESFETVHQMVSTVRGELRPGVGAADCLRAAFPGGSMTGAPKTRTMQIIDELEGRARGIYSGAIGYVGVDGAAEFGIVIRTVVRHGDQTSVGAGGAITILSDPDAEWREVLLKAESVLAALGVQAGSEGQAYAGRLCHGD